MRFIFFLQGRIHSPSVADGWAGAENLEKQKYDGQTDGHTVPSEPATPAKYIKDLQEDR